MPRASLELATDGVALMILVGVQDFGWLQAVAQDIGSVKGTGEMLVAALL